MSGRFINCTAQFACEGQPVSLIPHAPVDVGDKITTTITFVDSETGASTTCVVRTTVASTFSLAPRPGLRWKTGDGYIANNITFAFNGGWDRFFDEEGVTWVREWPPVNGPEAAALLMAEALGPGAVPETDVYDSWSSDAYDVSDALFDLSTPYDADRPPPLGPVR